MYCTNCGSENKEDAKYCTKCGAKMHMQESEEPKRETGQRLRLVLMMTAATTVVIAIAFVVFFVFGNRKDNGKSTEQIAIQRESVQETEPVENENKAEEGVSAEIVEEESGAYPEEDEIMPETDGKIIPEDTEEDIYNEYLARVREMEQTEFEGYSDVPGLDWYPWTELFKYNDLGYLMEDLDGNGVKELILGDRNEGKTLFCIWTIKDGKMDLVSQGGEKYLVKWYNDGSFSEAFATGSERTVYYRYVDGHKEEIKTKEVKYVAEQDLYCYYLSGNQISEEEYMKINSYYESKTRAFSFTELFPKEVSGGTVINDVYGIVRSNYSFSDPEEVISGALLYVVYCDEYITLRSTPSRSGSEICKIPLFSEVTYLDDAQNGFIKVSFNEYVGYCLAEYLDYFGPDIGMGVLMKVANCKESITLRDYPSKSANEICQIPLGEEVLVDRFEDNQFVRVRYGENTGYVLFEYLERPY